MRIQEVVLESIGKFKLLMAKRLKGLFWEYSEGRFAENVQKKQFCRPLEDW
jgi:hypothetical protein